MRTYQPADERSWLRCRVLGFLDTAYYDDVWTSKPATTGPDLVAVTGDGTVAGILVATVRGKAATIDTVVVHLDFRRQGIGQALHVYADRYTDAGEPGRAAVVARAGLTLTSGFLHGRMVDEQWARANFRRVHVCRRFARRLVSEHD